MVAREFRPSDVDPSQDPLWQRLDAFDFDTLDPSFPFTQHLAQENGWKEVYTARVIEEYKRFCYVAVRAEHPVCPPDQVDLVWHSHLSYSRNYWDVYCAKVLCADLHHESAGNGSDEDVDRKRDAYTATMDTYQILSAEQPPPDIWPIAELLFADTGSVRRVNTKNFLIIPRPPKALLWVAQLLLIFSTLYFLWQKDFLIAAIVGSAAAVIAIFRDRIDNKWVTKPWRDGDDDGTGSGGGSIRGI